MSLQSLHFAAPTIEIVSESPRLEMLQMRLKQAGLRPIRAPRQIDPALAAPILIDSATISERDQTVIISACQRQGNRPVVILGDSDTPMYEDVIHLRNVDQLSRLPSRLALRKRHLTFKREAQLREETISRLTKGPNRQGDTAQPRAIYCGPQSADFNALRALFSDDGITLVAALTPHTLKDMCADERTIAVIFDLTRPGEATESTLKTFLRAPARASVSSVLLSNTPQASAFTDQIDIVIETTGPVTDKVAIMAQHIHASARQFANQRPTDPSIRDTATGLFSRTFLEEHLEAQLKAADQAAQPLTVIGIELKDHLRGAKPATRELLKYLRNTDLAARYSARHIVISLPATAYSGAIRMARRLQAECDMIADVNVLERRQFHTTQSLLMGLLSRPDLAASRRA